MNIKNSFLKTVIAVSILVVGLTFAAVICGLTTDVLESHLSGNSSIEELDNQTAATATIATTATTTTITTTITNEDNHTSSTEGYAEYRYGLYSMTGDNENIVIERWITDRSSVNEIDCKYAFNIKDENNLDLLVYHEDDVCIHNDSSDSEIPYVIITENNNEIVKVDIYINSKVRFETVVISDNED